MLLQKKAKQQHSQEDKSLSIFSPLLGTFSRGYAGEAAGSSKAIGQAALLEIAQTKKKPRKKYTKQKLKRKL